MNHDVVDRWSPSQNGGLHNSKWPTHRREAITLDETAKIATQEPKNRFAPMFINAETTYKLSHNYRPIYSNI